MNKVKSTYHTQRGAALMTALAFLVVFTLAGSAYLGYMTIEVDMTRLYADEVRAQETARAGIEAAIGLMSAAFAQGVADQLVTSEPQQMRLPIFTYDRNTRDIVEDERYVAEISVWFHDEKARLNINHAPVRVLEAMLGVDGETARNIRASLPQTAEEMPDKRWLISLDDLVNRGFLSANQVRNIDPAWITVHTVPDPDHPVAYINLNSASPEVLAAVLGLTADVAEQAVAQRPFASLEDILAATGKESPEFFNITPDPNMPNTLPTELSLRSNCYRIRVESSFRRATRTRGQTASIEAVVVIVPGERPHVMYWTEQAVPTALIEEEAPEVG